MSRTCGCCRTLIQCGKFDDRDLYSGLIRLHVLHHACEAPIFGLGMVEELARYGYHISPGTLYPILHGLEKKGYLLKDHAQSFCTMKTGTARAFLRLGRPQLGSPPDAGFEALSCKTESNEKKNECGFIGS